MPHFPYRAGNYVLFAELGTGTLGTTLIGREATQAKGGFKPLAVRVLDVNLSQRPDVVRIFLDDQRAAALLTHPRIAGVHEVGALSDGSFFVASEYVHGIALREVMRNPQLQLTQAHAVQIAMQICDALHYAHERVDISGKPLEIVHGQISCDSVLVGFDGNVKIIEFGCLRTRNASVANVSVPARLQRRSVYMAPELRAQLQSSGGPNLDRRTDVYSVGALLWEMLTGENLTLEENDEAPPPPSSKRETPPELDAIVLKALAKNKDDRHASALALRLALSQLASKLFGEASVTTILARNMTIGFRQRMVAFQEQVDTWKKFDPETLPVELTNAPVTSNWKPQSGQATGNAFQSQRLSVGPGGSQRLNVGSVKINVGSTGTGVSDTGGRRSASDSEVPIFKKPLFMALLGVGVLTIIAALAIVLLRSGGSPWAIYVDSQPRGAEIKIDGNLVGNTPKRISNSTPPASQRVEVSKKGFRSEVRDVLPQPGETVHIEVELKPDEAAAAQ
ncbi:MAG TPA: serine/threonine-protein kinase [Pseudomonadota bacterium]|nr:serine/threonine-protein kinase [Pseudomonadota bacterium]